jgi:hypothetical protein
MTARNVADPTGELARAQRKQDANFALILALLAVTLVVLGLAI